MTLFLADHNIEGQARLLLRAIADQGWLELVPMRLVTLADVGLARDSSDRAIWHACQARRMLLLTANRSQEGLDSLESVLRSESTEGSLPVLTLADPDRLHDSAYRDAVVARVVEVVLYLDTYLGAGRVYIP